MVFQVISMNSKEKTGAICGDGMCPYVPCKDFPDCEHYKTYLEWIEEGE